MKGVILVFANVFFGCSGGAIENATQQDPRQKQ